MDGRLVHAGISLRDIAIESRPYISLKIEIKDNANHIGGINIFGEKYGDYPQGIVMNLTYE
ncbi:hypothetical protein NE599_21480 [[Clostridium] symbiosum]|uniref:hypothetical protein n=1 Tax=Clostridium symbiosum TaxID=1512 RepID=UPI00210B8A99|nr:hypothetical protein [[Clostridium] symbiosum]MCQ4991538.1 hypothetical protein [[Clostridium] symbiosum]